MRTTILCIVLALAAVGSGYAQTQAVTPDGRTVILNRDGTWHYVEDAPAEVPVDSQWDINVSVDPLTDETRTVLTVAASDERRSFVRPVALVVRKTGTTTEMYISWNSYLGFTRDLQPVSYRIDRGELVSARMTLSTSGQASFFAAQEVLPTIRQMLDATTLVARTTPSGQNTKTATFPIAGLRSIVEANPHLRDWLD